MPDTPDTSVPPDAWHKQGYWAVFDKDDVAVAESFATTGYSARAEAIRALNKRWSALLELGYYVKELKPAGKPLR
jgi:hypothetical protein